MGLVSFPIVTHLLAINEYGLLAIVNTTLLFLYALGKCGLPRALITEITKNIPSSSHKLYWNGILTVSLTSIIVCALYLTAAWGISYFFKIPKVFYFLPIIVLFRNILAVLQAWLRAVEKITWHNIMSSTFEICSTISALLALFYISPTVMAMIGSRMVFESIAVIALLSSSAIFIHKASCSAKTMKTLVSFGAPLVWLELSMIVMTFGDRYQIGYIMDMKSVGLYSAAYNLAQYAQQIISQPLVLAAYPLYNKLFSQKGPKETRIFLEKILNYYFAITIPILIFTSINAHNILSFLASAKYSASANIVPIVLSGNILNGCVPLISAGLYVTKHTKIIGKATILSALINFTLNWIFIKTWGYAGAAFSTLLSFIFLFIIIKKSADKFLKVNIYLKNCFKYFLISLVAISPSWFLTNQGPWKILVSGILFVTIYTFTIIIFDKEIFTQIQRNFYKFIQKNIQ